MVIYKTTDDYGEIKKGTRLLFNKSMQYFETFDHEYFITNDQSAKNPGLIIIYRELTTKSEKKAVWNIPW